MNRLPTVRGSAALASEVRDPTPAEQLETLRCKVLSFRAHVFGSQPLPPIVPNKFTKTLVIRILRLDRPLTKEIIDKLPAGGRVYVGTALSLLEIKLRHITPNNKGLQILLASDKATQLGPHMLDPTLAGTLAGIIAQSFGPSLDSRQGRPRPANPILSARPEPYAVEWLMPHTARKSAGIERAAGNFNAGDAGDS
jgi:hypothetical protein